MRTCGQPLRPHSGVASASAAAPPFRHCSGLPSPRSTTALGRPQSRSTTAPGRPQSRSTTAPAGDSPGRRLPRPATIMVGAIDLGCRIYGARTELAWPRSLEGVSLPGAGVLLRHVGAFDGRFAATEAPGRLPAGVSQEELRLLPQVNGAVHQQPKGTRPEGGVVRVQTARKLTRHQAKPSRRGNSAELPTDATPGRNWGCRRSTSVSPQMPDRGRR